jgi:hypothetical protein
MNECVDIETVFSGERQYVLPNAEIRNVSREAVKVFGLGTWHNVHRQDYPTLLQQAITNSPANSTRSAGNQCNITHA